jgi:hypothetical protein
VGKIRQSKYINRRQAESVLPAVQHAGIIGYPLNLMVSINFGQTACPKEEIANCFARLRKARFERWLRYLSSGSGGINCPPTFVWAIEDMPGNPHVHWLVHIPTSLQDSFKAKLQEWLNKLAGPVYFSNGALDVRAIKTPASAGKYILKGIDPRYAQHFYIRPEAQGIVFGKRCGTSQNIGKMARHRWLVERSITRVA